MVCAVARSSESHAHRLAKELVVAWVRSAAKHAGYDGHAAFGAIEWRVNRRWPSWGIWSEYPLCRQLLHETWDEASPRWRRRPPTFAELCELDIAPDAVLDVAIQHKGRIAWAIEVVHKHPVDDEKLNFLRYWADLTLVEIPAYWVLGQIGVPSAIPAEFFLTL